MGLNTGQCIPLNAIVQGFIDTVERDSLDPAKMVLWMARGRLACNFPLFPYHMKCLLESHGNGMEKTEVYVGDMLHLEISPLVTIRTYFAYLFGGLLRKIGCQVRPYEMVPGQTDRAIAEALELLTGAFLGKRPLRKTFEVVARLLGSIPVRKHPRPKVAIFGDLYVRDNPAMNQDLIGAIEEAGGEVITTPYADYLKIISSAYFEKWIQEGSYLTWLTNRSLLAAVEALETRYRGVFGGYHRSTAPTPLQEVERILARFHLRIQHEGESFDNLLKVHHIVREHPDVALFVQANPAFCCPALVTEAMGRDIERATGVPVLTVTYDGTSSFKNDVVVPFIKYRRSSRPREG
jgi:predicted nucleotide-binding protein (sugar kinase/HSP70/actin superfamily)